MALTSQCGDDQYRCPLGRRAGSRLTYGRLFVCLNWRSLDCVPEARISVAENCFVEP
jgi:hypothetical protein